MTLKVLAVCVLALIVLVAGLVWWRAQHRLPVYTWTVTAHNPGTNLSEPFNFTTTAHEDIGLKPEQWYSWTVSGKTCHVPIDSDISRLPACVVGDGVDEDIELPAEKHP